MNTQEILNSGLNKTKKAVELMKLGWTNRQVADALMNGNVGFAYNVRKKYLNETIRNGATQIAPFLFNRKFGIEIEAFGVNRSTLLRELRQEGIEVEDEGYNHTTRPHWKIVTDGSISGENPFEIVSPILEGEDGLQQLDKVSRALVRCHARINKSCGMHVHLDASDLNLKAWKNIYKSYINLEDMIDSMMPLSRRSNNGGYCKSLIIANKETLMNKIDGLTTVAGISRLYNSRYFKINAQSYARHGSIEFRQHSGTIEFHKIKNWLMILAQMVHRSQYETATNFDFLNADAKAYLDERIQDFQ